MPLLIAKNIGNNVLLFSYELHFQKSEMKMMKQTCFLSHFLFFVKMQTENGETKYNPLLRLFISSMLSKSNKVKLLTFIN